MKRNFWHNKKILLTGHTGFKGSWLSLWLQKLKANCIGYALQPPTEPNLFQLAHISDDMNSILGDIRDLDHLTSTIIDYQPEIIFHLAAQSLVKFSYKNPIETYQTNIMGTVNVLEAARQSNSVRVIVIVTSDKCYENKGWIWGYRESDTMGGYDPYSSSKGCAELITAAYRNSYFHPQDYQQHGVAIATVRAGNVIGGGDWAQDRLIPDIINAIIKQQDLLIRNPDAVRPWQHVLDPLNGYLSLAQYLWEQGADFGGAWNFGPNNNGTQPVSWIVNRLIELWDEEVNWTMDVKAHPHEDNYLKLDCTRANTVLKWLPKLELSLALEWVVEWYKGYVKNEDIRQLTETQIHNFESLK